MSKLFKHLKVIRTHRKYVKKACFKMGIPWQGLIHDLSKYSLTELSIYKYYTGTQSPHDVCREQLGYSPCWMHHYHKNKHHWEYWLDILADGTVKPVKMPYKYVIELVCDIYGASKAYNLKNWQPNMLVKFWNSHGKIMHENSLILATFLIKRLADVGENYFFKWYKTVKNDLKFCYDKDTPDTLLGYIDYWGAWYND